MPGVRRAGALEAALGEVFPAHWVERPKDRNAFEVVKVDRGEDRNEYRQEHWVGIDPKDRKITLRPYDWDLGHKVTTEFNRHLGLVTASAVTNMLADILRSFSGTHLGGRGNIYWISDNHLPVWRRVIDVVEKSFCQGGGNQIYLIKHQMTADEVKAVKDAIVEEVASESARLHQEITSGELGERALLTRQAQVDTLREKIAVYEGLLSVGLGHLRDGLDRAEEAAVAAKLLVGAGEPAGV